MLHTKLCVCFLKDDPFLWHQHHIPSTTLPTKPLLKVIQKLHFSSLSTVTGRGSTLKYTKYSYLMVFLYQCLLQIYFCSVPNERIWIEERLDDWMTHVLHCGRANSRSWNATRSQDAWLTSAIFGGSSAYLRLILQWKSFSYYWLINPKLIYFNLVLVRQIAVRKQPHAYFSQRLKLIIDWALPNPWLIDLKLGIRSCCVLFRWLALQFIVHGESQPGMKGFYGFLEDLGVRWLEMPRI